MSPLPEGGRRASSDGKRELLSRRKGCESQGPMLPERGLISGPRRGQNRFRRCRCPDGLAAPSTSETPLGPSTSVRIPELQDSPAPTSWGTPGRVVVRPGRGQRKGPPPGAVFPLASLPTGFHQASPPSHVHPGPPAAREKQSGRYGLSLPVFSVGAAVDNARNACRKNENHGRPGCATLRSFRRVPEA